MGIIVMPLLLLGIWTSGHYLAHAFSSGAPENSCPTMSPLHGASKQATPPPYSITVSSHEIAPSQIVTVTLSGINGTKFEGFLVTARSSDFSVGTMAALTNNTKLICKGEYMTHETNDVKNEVSFSWKAPEDWLEGIVIDFKATVVQERLVFWKDVVQPYPVVIVPTPPGLPIPGPAGGNSSMTRAPDTTTLSPVTTAKIQFPGHLSTDKDCGQQKACFHDCQAKSGQCTYIVTWSSDQDTDQDSLTFTLTYRLTEPHEHWIALGFSKDQEMGDDSVTECIMNNGEVEVKQSYNHGLDNKYLDNKHAALSEMGGSIQNGILSCSFRRKKTYPYDPMVFDLHHDYFLLVAMGESIKGTKMPHTFDVLPPVSGHQINFMDMDDVGGKVPPVAIMVQIHGALMMIGWVMLTSVGVMTAKYGKLMFPKVNPCGANIWLHIHRGCMITVAVMTVIGVVVMFVQCKGYCQIPQLPGKSHWPLHPPLGLLVLILTIINPIMAVFRPAPKAPNRFVFDWSHWGLGVLAWIMASFAILIGLSLERAHAPPEALYVMVAWGIYHVLIIVAMEMLPRPLCRLYSAVAERTLQRGRVYNLERAHQDNLGYAAEDENTTDTPQTPDDLDTRTKDKAAGKELTPEELKVQKLLLMVHYGVLVILTFSLLLLVFLYTPSSASSSL
ncbi:hypothetical protein ACOMHN_004003 [Nucella lapillus]